MKFITAGDVTLHMEYVEGPPAAPLLVFVNALGCDLRIWDDVVAALNGVAPIVRYDKRGHGLSDTGTPPFTMDDHAADLGVLIDEFDPRRAVICGLSIGGLVAQALCLARPDRVDGLILCDTGARIGTADQYDDRIADVMSNGMAPFAGRQMMRWFSEGFRASHPEAVAGARNMLSRQPPDGYIGSCAAIRDADYGDRLGEIRKPVLCLAGEHDRSTPPEQMRVLAESLPDARFLEIAGAGHLPCIEAPGIVAGMIDGFLRQFAMSEAAGEPVR